MTRQGDLDRFRAGYQEWLGSEDGDEDNVRALVEALEARVAEAERGWTEASAARHRLLLEVKTLEAHVTGLEAARVPRYDHPSLRDIMFDAGYDREEGYWIACTADGRHCETGDDPVHAFRRLLNLLLLTEVQP